MTELLPCPFCGGEAELSYCGWVSCHNCGCDGPYTGDSPDEAAAAWNTRDYSDLVETQRLLDKSEALGMGLRDQVRELEQQLAQERGWRTELIEQVWRSRDA